MVLTHDFGVGTTIEIDPQGSTGSLRVTADEHECNVTLSVNRTLIFPCDNLDTSLKVHMLTIEGGYEGPELVACVDEDATIWSSSPIPISTSFTAASTSHTSHSNIATSTESSSQTTDPVTPTSSSTATAGSGVPGSRAATPNISVIVGGVVGGATLVALVGLLLFCQRRRQRSRMHVPVITEGLLGCLFCDVCDSNQSVRLSRYPVILD